MARRLEAELFTAPNTATRGDGLALCVRLDVNVSASREALRVSGAAAECQNTEAQGSEERSTEHGRE
jgi:hypothetical protein